MVGFVDMAQHCAPHIGISTLAAIVKTESGFNPLAIGINVKKNTPKPKINPPKTTDDAIATSKWLLAQGYNIDMGLGQINSSNLSGLGLTVDDMFNPCSNINAAGVILKGNYQSAIKDASSEEAALYAAISAYNTGSPTKGFHNGYVNSVISNSSVDVSNVDINVPELIQNKPEVIQAEFIKNENKTSNSIVIPIASAPVQDTPVQEPQKNQVMVYQANKSNTIIVY